MVCLISGDIKLSLKVMYHNHLDYQVDKRIINIEVRNKTIDITESRSNILLHSENVNSIVKGTILTLSIVWFILKKSNSEKLKSPIIIEGSGELLFVEIVCIFHYEYLVYSLTDYEYK